MDNIRSKDGRIIMRHFSYAILVESNTEIVCQYSRHDTYADGMALVTTIAYSIK